MSKMFNLYTGRAVINEEVSYSSTEIARVTGAVEALRRNIKELASEVSSNRVRLNEYKKQQDKILERNPKFVELSHAHNALHGIVETLIDDIKTGDIFKDNDVLKSMEESIQDLDNKLNDIIENDGIKNSAAFIELESRYEQNEQTVLSAIEDMRDIVIQHESKYASQLDSLLEKLNKIDARQDNDINSMQELMINLESRIDDIEKIREEDKDEMYDKEVDRDIEDENKDQMLKGLEMQMDRTELRPPSISDKPALNPQIAKKHRR